MIAKITYYFLVSLARAYAQESEHEYVDKLKRIQTVIIDINTSISKSNNSNYTSIGSSHINELEAWLDEYTKELPPPEQYIIPVSELYMFVYS